MKKIILLGLFCMFLGSAFAEVGSDSLAYQLQRKKINRMLADRADKFGQYDVSLKKHTGIFGLQTKKDIRRSQDILMDIIRTDNDIYKELKILLEYRAYQQKQVQSHSQEVQGSNLGFMNTVNKLRQDNERIKAELAQEKNHFQTIKNLFIIVFVLMLASILFLVTRKTKRSA